MSLSMPTFFHPLSHSLTLSHSHSLSQFLSLVLSICPALSIQQGAMGEALPNQPVSLAECHNTTPGEESQPESHAIPAACFCSCPAGVAHCSSVAVQWLEAPVAVCIQSNLHHHHRRRTQPFYFVTVSLYALSRNDKKLQSPTFGLCHFATPYPILVMSSTSSTFGLWHPVDPCLSY